MDLWRFKVRGAKEISAALQLYDFDFKTWSRIVQDIENPKARKVYLEQGRIVMAYENQLVNRIAGKANRTLFAGTKCLIVNSPILESQVGNALVKRKSPIGIILYYDGGGIKFSLRSQGATDVSRIAKRFGGGGQQHAAGFYTKRKLRLF